MTSSDFRQIAARTEAGRSERLFRAAVSAFCSLTRPTRREIGQLEDLVLPLIGCVSREAKRFVAAALSEAEFAPPNLVRRLAEEPVEVSAPLLLLSATLSDVDLIGLIGRHGIGHARVIARRENLNPVIDDLITALMVSAGRETAFAEPHMDQDDLPELAQLHAIFAEADALAGSEEHMPPRRTQARADAVREQLRAMMTDTTHAAEEGYDEVASKPLLDVRPRLKPQKLAQLREMALTGNRDFLQTALADCLGIAYAQARTILGRASYGDLIPALKSLEVVPDTAFMIAAAAWPQQFNHAEAVRLFLDRYHLCHPEAAREKLRAWRADSIAPSTSRTYQPKAHAPANSQAAEIRRMAS